jgi:heme oxygenase (biliverdin-IX-beta and delta-forming)
MTKPEHATEARALLDLPRGSLGSLAERDGRLYPFVSLVLPARSAEGEIILLLSDLSDHAKNLQRDPRASLLMDGTLDLKEPLTGPRLTLLGEVQVSPDQSGDKARYLAVHPEAELYVGFGDFRFYRFRILEGLFVAGFGRIFRLKAEELRD